LKETPQVPRLEYDKEADALYISLRDFDKVAYTKSRREISRNIDDEEDGVPISVEFWNVHRGLDLDGVPEREAVTQLLAEHHFNVFA